MFADQTLALFLKDLASRTPAPGGGAACGISGALGAALGSMCANYTIGDEKFKTVEPKVKELLEKFELERVALLHLADKDAQAYGSWQAARKLPQSTPEEKATRKQAIAKAQEDSTRIPEMILEQAEAVLGILAQLTPLCNPQLVADAAVSAYLLDTAARGAGLQVLGNLIPRNAPPPDPTQPPNEDERTQRTRERILHCGALRVAIENAVYTRMNLRPLYPENSAE